MKRFLIILTSFLIFTAPVSAQESTLTNTPAQLLVSAVAGVEGDELGGIIFDFGGLWLLTYAKNVDVRVGAPDTTGSVTLRINDKSYPAAYVAPSLFEGWHQINVFIPKNEFQPGATVYLRICDLAGKCKNSTGATLRR